MSPITSSATATTSSSVSGSCSRSNVLVSIVLGTVIPVVGLLAVIGIFIYQRRSRNTYALAARDLVGGSLLTNSTVSITVEPFPPPGARPPIATHPTPPRKPYRRILLGPAAPDENGRSDDLPPAAGDNTTSTPLPPSHQNPAAEEMIPPPSHSGN